MQMYVMKLTNSKNKKAWNFGDKLSLRMILGSPSTQYTLLNCSKWLEGRQRCNIEQKASTIYQQDNLNVFRQQNFLPVFYQKKAGDMPLAISSPHQHHALLCTLVCYGFRLLSLYIGHMLSNVNGPFSYTKIFLRCCVCFQFPIKASQIWQQKNCKDVILKQ